MASKRPLDLCNTPPSKKLKLGSLNSPTRQFQHSWKLDHSWLSYDAKSKLMFCDICIKVQKSNSFTTGCAILKRDNVTKHAKCKGKLFHIVFFDCGVGVGW